MVGVAQFAERLFSKPEAAGANPVIHPTRTYLDSNSNTKVYLIDQKRSNYINYEDFEAKVNTITHSYSLKFAGSTEQFNMGCQPSVINFLLL